VKRHGIRSIFLLAAWAVAGCFARRRRPVATARDRERLDFRTQTRGMGLRGVIHDLFRRRWLKLRRPDEDGSC
jgi:hypothetical protein